MIIDDTDQLKQETDIAISERSESDERNYTLSNLIMHDAAIVNFQNCETFTQPPFDRCASDGDKRRMMAALLSGAAASRVEKLSAPAIAENYPLIDRIYTQMKEFEPDYLYKDPYINSISLPLGEKNGYLFGIEDVKRGQLFHYDAPMESGYSDIPRLGYFNADVRWPIVTRNGQLVASLSPNYFETIKRHVSVSSENVLCLGLKLGYFPFLASMKESVRTVTVVEKDPQLVALFENQLLAQFPHAEKIIVLNDDPVEFMQRQWITEYRHVFICCGRDAMSSVSTYMQMKKLEKSHRKTKFTYWIEESILSNIKSALLIYMASSKEPDKKELYKTLAGDESGEEILNAVRPFADQIHLRSTKEMKSLFTNRILARRIAGSVN